MPSRETVPTTAIGSKLRSREGAPEDARIAELANRQHGVVGRQQLRDLGLGPRAIQHRLEVGRLHRLHAGVYAVGHRVVPRTGWWLAAVLDSGPHAVLSHGSAATFWGLRGYSTETTHVTVPHKSTSSRRIRRHTSVVPEDERRAEDGIPVTSPPRTILDLAATEPLDVVVAMLRELEFLELHDRLSLPHLLERYPGRRGVRKVRLALRRLEEEPPGRRRSKLEERFGPFVRRHHLPHPHLND